MPSRAFGDARDLLRGFPPAAVVHLVCVAVFQDGDILLSGPSHGLSKLNAISWGMGLCITRLVFFMLPIR